MPENLNWNFNLMNGVAGPAAEMAGALDILTKKLNEASSNFDELEKAMKKIGSGAGVASSGLAKFGLELSAIKEIAAPLLEAGKFALEKGWDFEKKSVEALAFKESTLASFETLLGSAKEAQDFFSQAAWLGKATPFQTKDVVGAFQGLLAAGFTKQEVPVVFQAIGDASALKGFDTQVIQRLTLAFSEMMSQGKADGQTMRMVLRDAAGSGLSKEKIDLQLAKNLGVDKNSIAGMVIPARDAVKAMIDVLAETAGGGVTGGGMFRLQDTFTGIMSTLESTFSDFFLTLKGTASDVEGFRNIKGALINLREALDTTKPAGKALQDSVVSAFNSISNAMTGTLSGPDGLRTMTDAIEKAAVVIGNLGHVGGAALDGLWAGGKSFANALGLIDDTAGSLFEGPMTPENIDKLKRSMVDFGKDAGEAMAILAASLKDIFGAMLSAVKLAGAVVEINTAPTAYDKEQAWGHAFEAMGMKKKAMVEGKDFFQPGKDYDGTTYDAQGRASMSKTPGAGASHYNLLPPINVTVHSGHDDPDAVGAAAGKGASSALQQHAEAIKNIAVQAGHH